MSLVSEFLLAWPAQGGDGVGIRVSMREAGLHLSTKPISSEAFLSLCGWGLNKSFCATRQGGKAPRPQWAEKWITHKPRGGPLAPCKGGSRAPDMGAGSRKNVPSAEWKYFPGFSSPLSIQVWWHWVCGWVSEWGNVCSFRGPNVPRERLSTGQCRTPYSASFLAPHKPLSGPQPFLEVSNNNKVVVWLYRPI